MCLKCALQNPPPDLGATRGEADARHLPIFAASSISQNSRIKSNGPSFLAPGSLARPGELKTFFPYFSGVEYGPKYAIFFGRGRGVFRVFRSVFPYWRRSGQINGHLRKKRHRRCALKQRRPSKRSFQAKMLAGGDADAAAAKMDSELASR